MKKIKFDEATKKKAGEVWCQGSYGEMIDFLADAANRQLEEGDSQLEEGDSQPLVKGTDNQRGTIEFDEVGYWRKKFDDVLIRAEKAEAAMERVRKDIECALSNDPGPRHKDWNEGYNDSCRDMAANLGFTIVPAVPAQPLKVLRHD